MGVDILEKDGNLCLHQLDCIKRLCKSYKKLNFLSPRYLFQKELHSLKLNDLKIILNWKKWLNFNTEAVQAVYPFWQAEQNRIFSARWTFYSNFKKIQFNSGHYRMIILPLNKKTIIFLKLVVFGCPNGNQVLLSNNSLCSNMWDFELLHALYFFSTRSDDC